MALDVARGMAYLHSRTPPVIHRDLKSPNLLVDSNFKVKICDFGMSRLMSHGYISTKGAAGTPQWCSPEVLSGDKFIDGKSDVWSFAVVLFELVTQEVPWAGMTPQQSMYAMFAGRRLMMPDWVQPEVSALVRDCWHEEAAERPSFEEIIARLGKLKELLNSKQG